MTERRRPLRAAVWAVSAVAAVLLGGCSDEEAGPLTEDQLPGEVVESESSTRGTPTATLCPALTRAQEQVASRRASADDSYRYWTYRLEDDTWIAVTVIDPGVDLQDWEETLDQVRAAVDSCAEREDVGAVAALDDLPEDTVGYSSTRADSNGTSEGETVIARAGERIVMLAATHDQGAEPSIDVRNLLADVLERVADLDLG